MRGCFKTVSQGCEVFYRKAVVECQEHGSLFFTRNARENGMVCLEEDENIQKPIPALFSGALMSSSRLGSQKMTSSHQD